MEARRQLLPAPGQPMLPAVKPTLPLSVLGLSVLPLFAACFSTGDELSSSSSTSTDTSTDTSTSTSGASMSSSSSGMGGGGGGAIKVDTVLGELRADTTGTLLKYAGGAGWPLPVEGGYLFVSTDLSLSLCAGDHDQWAGQPMKLDMG